MKRMWNSLNWRGRKLRRRLRWRRLRELILQRRVWSLLMVDCFLSPHGKFSSRHTAEVCRDILFERRQRCCCHDWLTPPAAQCGCHDKPSNGDVNEAKRPLLLACRLDMFDGILISAWPVSLTTSRDEWIKWLTCSAGPLHGQWRRLVGLSDVIFRRNFVVLGHWQSLYVGS